MLNHSNPTWVPSTESGLPSHGRKDKWRIQVVSRSDVIEQMESSKAEIIRLAKKVLQNDPEFEKELTLQLLDFRDPLNRFEQLDLRMEKGGIETLIISHPFHIQELTGTPVYRLKPETVAIYPRGSKQVYILEPSEKAQEVDLQMFPFWDRYLDGKQIGVEEDSLNVRVAEALGLLGGLSARCFASQMLSEWRCELSAFEVPYTVLAAKITVGAIENLFRRLRDEKQWEEQWILAELHKNYPLLLQRAIADSSFKLEAIPTETLIRFHDLGITIEAGIHLVDKDKRVRAGSRVIRTLILDSQTDLAYQQLRRMVSQDMAASCFTNARGRDIYLTAIHSLDPVQELKQYPYHCGLVYHKLPLLEEVFDQHSEFLLDTGAVGIIQWSFSEQLVYGDMFIAHPHIGLNLTNHHPF